MGSGIGGGLIIDGEIYRGCGRGAAEIGHLRVHHSDRMVPLERVASGWGMQQQAEFACMGADCRILEQLAGEGPVTAALIARAAREGDEAATAVLAAAREALAEGICHVLALLCPRRLVIGGGVSLMGESVLFEPLRRMVAERVFKPFAGCYDIVPAALGEEVVVHGALALARKRLSE